MQKIAIISIGEAGDSIARQLQPSLGASVISRQEVAACWHEVDALVFVGAMGICVRTIAPYVEDKHSDPAVVCVDTCGQHVISVLSGHIGGANDLTKAVAHILGATPVITTQSDLAGLWSLDTLARQFHWNLAGQAEINECIFAFVNRQPTALLLEVRDEGTEYLESTLPEHVTIVETADEVTPQRFRLLLIISPFKHDTPRGVRILHFVPKVATIGIGLAHQAQPAATILEEMRAAFAQQGLLPCARDYCTIDVKADEPFVGLLRQQGQNVRFFTAAELATVDVPNPSPTVEKHVGTPSVCEAAALLGSNFGQLVVPKLKGTNWTAALAIDSRYLRSPRLPLGSSQCPLGSSQCLLGSSAEEIVPEDSSVALAGETPLGHPSSSLSGHIEIVGAGPGDPELVSVRGRRFLEQADLILYAGSLVPRELTECHKPGAVVLSSATMALEEQCALMQEHYDQGHLIVRLHTGDPCIFGAIQEQMAYFDAHQMSYHITPGISSFLAAAAELRSQFTIPERTQTIILTRGEGRTPMPDREKLHLLARSRSTMCIFLSAAIVDDVQRELLQEYPEDTPVAACYHLTWPDQHIYRGQLRDLARIVHEHDLTLTTMLVVGEAIDNRRGLSELYNRHFTHLFRKGKA